MKLKKVEENAFTESNLTSAESMRYTLYSGHAIKVIKDQIAKTPADQFFFDCEGSDAISHPMKAVIGTKVCKEAERTIKTSRGTDASWERMSDDREQSVVLCLQRFSDKSQIFFSAGAAQLYHLHASSLSFSANARCRPILSGTTILAYLLVFLECDGQGTKH